MSETIVLPKEHIVELKLIGDSLRQSIVHVRSAAYARFADDSPRWRESFRLHFPNIAAQLDDWDALLVSNQAMTEFDFRLNREIGGVGMDRPPWVRQTVLDAVRTSVLERARTHVLASPVPNEWHDDGDGYVFYTGSDSWASGVLQGVRDEVRRRQCESAFVAFLGAAGSWRETKDLETYWLRAGTMRDSLMVELVGVLIKHTFPNRCPLCW